MPGDPLKPLLPGDQPPNTAEFFNAAIEAIQATRRRDTGGGPIRERPRAADVVKVRNQSGAAVDRWGVLALGDPTILPSANEDEFQRQVVFDAAAPTGSTPFGRFVVLTEPLPAGAIGLAVLAGVVQCRLSVPGSLGTYAECANANTTSLVTGSTGSARVLWAESSGTTRWAIVRLGDGLASVPGIAWAEVDGSPSYTGITSVTVDQSDGLVLSQPGGSGTLRIDLAEAQGTQAGIVTNAAQTWNGNKTFAAYAFFADPKTYYGGNSLTTALAVLDASTANWTKILVLDGSTGATVKEFAFTAAGRIIAQNGFSVGIAGSGPADGVTATDAMGNVFTGGILTTAQTSASSARTALGIAAEIAAALAAEGFGTAAYEDTGDSGATIPMCDNASTTMSGDFVVEGDLTCDNDIQGNLVRAYAASGAAQLIVTNGSLGAGFAMDGFGNTPYVAWNNTSARIAYMGGYTDDDIQLVLEAGNDFRVEGGSLVLGSGAEPSGGGDCLVISQSSDPTGMGSDTWALYGKDVAGTCEGHVINEAGTITQVTPHNFAGPSWLYDADDPLPRVLYEENVYLGYRRWTNLSRRERLADMTAAERAALSADKRQCVAEEWYEPTVKWGEVQAALVARRRVRIAAQQLRRARLKAVQDAYDRLDEQARRKVRRPAGIDEPDLVEYTPKPMPTWLRDRLAAANRKRAEIRAAGQK